MIFSNLVNIVCVILLLGMLVSLYVDMYMRVRQSNKIAQELSRDAIKLAKQNDLLREQNNLLKDRLKEMK